MKFKLLFRPVWLLVPLFLAFASGTALLPGCESSGGEEAESSKTDTLPLTEIKFKETVFDFGKITQGEIVEHKFEFQNTGSKPLKIYRVSSSCGCTTPDYPQGFIAPGDKAVITVAFNSAGKEGEQKKRASIFVNTKKKRYDLKISGEVVEGKSKPSSKALPEKSSERPDSVTRYNPSK